MVYREFLTHYDQAYDAWASGSLPADQVEAEVRRLMEVAGRLSSPTDQQRAQRLLTRWRSAAIGEAAGRMGRASRALSRASSPEGTDAERTARAFAGMDEIAAIASEADDEGEEAALLTLNGSLARIIESLRPAAE